MIRSLLFWSIVVISAVLVYNRFWGDISDKERSQKVFGEARELFQSVADVVKSEKQKIESGRYDQALGNIRNLFEKMRSSADENKDLLNQIDELEEKRKSIEERLNKIRAMPADNTAAAVSKQNADHRAQEAEQIKSEMDDLLLKTNDLLNEIEKDQKKEQSN